MLKSCTATYHFYLKVHMLNLEHHIILTATLRVCLSAFGFGFSAGQIMYMEDVLYVIVNSEW